MKHSKHSIVIIVGLIAAIVSLIAFKKYQYAPAEYVFWISVATIVAAGIASAIHDWRGTKYLKYLMTVERSTFVKTKKRIDIYEQIKNGLIEAIFDSFPSEERRHVFVETYFEKHELTKEQLARHAYSFIGSHSHLFREGYNAYFVNYFLANEDSSATGFEHRYVIDFLIVKNGSLRQIAILEFGTQDTSRWQQGCRHRFIVHHSKK